MIIDIEIIQVYATFGPLDFEYGLAKSCASPTEWLGRGDQWLPHFQHHLQKNGVIRAGDNIRWQLPPPRLERV